MCEAALSTFFQRIIASCNRVVPGEVSSLSPTAVEFLGLGTADAANGPAGEKPIIQDIESNVPAQGAACFHRFCLFSVELGGTGLRETVCRRIVRCSLQRQAFLR